MKRLSRFVDFLSVLSGYVASWIILLLTLTTCYEVFLRYVMGAPTLWAYDLGYMFAGSFFLLGGALTLRDREHIRIDVLYGHLPKKWQGIIDIVGYLLFIPALIGLTYSLGDYALEAWQTGETSGESAWNPVVWPFRVIFVIGFLLLLLQAIVEFLRSFPKIFSEKQSEDQ